MKLTAISFAIFLCYFTFSVFVNSTFIVIEQSLYEYGEDSDSVAVLQKLESLAYLEMAWNDKLTSLPAEFGQLKNLTNLGLQGNPISESEQEKIRKLLPNVDIQF
jgi:Leucine-rich repeat (LRR) protein